MKEAPLAPALSKRQKQAYETLVSAGPLTGMELEERAKVPGLRVRLTELAQRGLVHVTGRRVCLVTGKVAEEWAVT